MTKLGCVFPSELFLRILYHSDPQDVVRWRAVSKWFYAIGCDRLLWKSMYQDAPFPRPPGSFADQSQSSLERALVKAAQLARSWTTRPMRAKASTSITLTPCFGRAPPNFICGRWLVRHEILRACQRFMLRDVDPTVEMHSLHVLQVFERSRDLEWEVKWVLSAEGQLIVYIFTWKSASYQENWKMFEFRLNHDTGELLGSTEIQLPPDARRFGDREEPRDTSSQFLFIPARPCCLVFDTQTRLFYRLPCTPDRPSWQIPRKVNIPDAHLIILLGDDAGWARNSLQVFALPPDGTLEENGARDLCLTHEGFIPDHIVNVEFVRPTNDLATGATNLILVGGHEDEEDHRIICVELTLPRRSADEVLPITTETHYIRPPKDVQRSRRKAWHPYIDVSNDGHIRGFYRAMEREGRRKSRSRPEPQDIQKFAIDTTQDPWAITHGPFAPAEWSKGEDPVVHVARRDDGIKFDGMRGRLYFGDPVKKGNLAIVDIE